MTLLVRHPVTYREERLYIYHVVFKEFLGFDYRLIAEERRDTLITAEGEEAWQLIVSEVLFQIPAEKWLSNESLPAQPLERWKVSNDLPEVSTISREIEVIYGIRLEGGHFYLQDDNEITLGLDIFGSIFFMLTRYEEIVKKDRDQHDRFPAIASLAYQEGFLERPIVNEYLEILWWSMKRLWPNLERKKREFQVYLSHDVDWPLGIAGNNPLRVLKTAAGDVLKRKDFYLSMRRLKSLAKVSMGNVDADINNTFDFIMDLSERKGLRSAFYFIADHTAGEVDGIYHLDNPWIRKLMRKIHKREHEIGLHASYNSFRNPDQIKKEFKRLILVAEEENIYQESWGGRQHYLRWEAPATWQAWEEAGLTYDSTLTYADRVGFRCGVCFEYPVFNLLQRKTLKLRERPLIIMEGTMFGKEYMGLSHEESISLLRRLVETCKLFNGHFSLLWHNSSLLSKRELELYSNVIMNI